MADWTKSMQQSYEFYIVDPDTWKDKTLYRNVTSCSIERDLETDTLGSATIDITGSIEECYMRVYLVTIQNGVKEKHPLGTFLVQPPATKFDGKCASMSADAYTPLIVLKENPPPIGYFIPKYRDVLEAAYDLTKENAKAPVVAGNRPKTWYIESAESVYKPHNSYLPAKDWIEQGTVDLHLGDVLYDISVVEYPAVHTWSRDGDGYRWVATDAANLNDTRLTSNFVADPSETWFQYLSGLLSSVDKRYDLDEMGNILFAPVQETDKMQAIWTYTDDNSSILGPEVDTERDLFGIPNVVEVIYSTNNGVTSHWIAENHDKNSPLSIENRGRRITHRVTDPGFIGVPDKRTADIQTKEYAIRLLKELSTVECKIRYAHGYCPVRIGDCVRLNYTRAGLENIKAKVVSQSISCTTGCLVSETAVYNNKLLNEDYITVKGGNSDETV